MTVLAGLFAFSFFDFVRSVTPFPFLPAWTPMILSLARPEYFWVCLFVRLRGSLEKYFSFRLLTRKDDWFRIHNHRRSFEK